MRAACIGHIYSGKRLQSARNYFRSGIFGEKFDQQTSQ